MMPMVWRCFQTMFLKKWIKASDLELPSGNSYRICLAYIWKAADSPGDPVFFYQAVLGPVTRVGPQGVTDVASLANDSPNQSMVVLGFLRDIQVAISLHASFPVYDKYMIFYIYTVQKTL